MQPKNSTDTAWKDSCFILSKKSNKHLEKKQKQMMDHSAFYDLFIIVAWLKWRTHLRWEKGKIN